MYDHDKDHKKKKSTTNVTLIILAIVGTLALITGLYMMIKSNGHNAELDRLTEIANINLRKVT